MKVVIPSSRSINLKYLEPLIQYGADFIIIDDSDGSIKFRHPNFRFFNRQDIKKILGKDEVSIPRRNGACRNFGFYLAWKECAADEIIIALDDDCAIIDSGFPESVEKNFFVRERVGTSNNDLHFNILDLYQEIPDTLFPRGFPYIARLDYEPWKFEKIIKASTMFNLGLWKGVFDINAIDKIKAREWNHPNAKLKFDSILIPNGSLISVCSMNMHFRKEIIPAIYQLPMHVEVIPGWPVDRYGDIWGGFILKTLMDLRGDNMTVGAPMIYHIKEGDFQRNIWQEHLCHLLNDEFIDFLRSSNGFIEKSGYISMMVQLNEYFIRNKHKLSSPL
ncbi:MAG: hypothetical protein HZB98_10375, partial [Bacteroidia bacterium]|nr:hypothetical protein [Bacteroidia bacterium]